MNNTFIALGVVAVTELLKRIKASDWEGTAIIVVAAVLGAIAGWQHIQGVANIGDGLALGLAAVGVHQISRNIG